MRMRDARKKHELYKVSLSFTVVVPPSEADTGKEETYTGSSGDLLVMTKNDDIAHLAEMLKDEFIGKPEPRRYYKNGFVQKVHITDLRKMKYQPSLGVIVEE